MSYGGLFDPQKKEERIQELEKIMGSLDFWSRILLLKNVIT